MGAPIPFKRYFFSVIIGSAVLFAGIADLVAVMSVGSLAGLVETMNQDAGYRMSFIVGGAAGLLIGILLLYIGMANLRVRFDRALEVERTKSETQAQVLEARLTPPSYHLPPRPPP